MDMEGEKQTEFQSGCVEKRFCDAQNPWRPCSYRNDMISSAASRRRDSSFAQNKIDP